MDPLAFLYLVGLLYLLPLISGVHLYNLLILFLGLLELELSLEKCFQLHTLMEPSNLLTLFWKMILFLHAEPNAGILKWKPMACSTQEGRVHYFIGLFQPLQICLNALSREIITWWQKIGMVHPVKCCTCCLMHVRALCSGDIQIKSLTPLLLPFPPTRNQLCTIYRTSTCFDWCVAEP